MIYKVSVIGLILILFVSSFTDIVGEDVKQLNGLSDNEIFLKETGSNTGNVLYVGGNGPNNYSSIQNAIDNASNGDTIFVYSGIYHENVVVKKSISLVGENRNATIIDGGMKDTVINITASSVKISNFTVTNGTSYSVSAGIKISGSNCVIEKCNVVHNMDYGIWIVSSDNNSIKNCNISYSEFESGIFIDGSKNNLVSQCIFMSNNQSGIILKSSSNDIISDCVFNFNGWYGLSIFLSNNESILNCTFRGDGLFISGDNIHNFIHEIKNNTVNGLPLRYYKNMKNFTIEGEDAGEIILANCEDFSIENIKINKKEIGIEMAFCKNGVINGSDINEAYEALILFYSSYISISNSSIKNCLNAVLILFSSENAISSCNIIDDKNGIMLWESSFNKIYGCNIERTTNSIVLYGYSTFGNFITRNNFIDNRWDPIFGNSIHNIWLRNYWSNWHIPFPKPIFGINFIFNIFQFPWVQFDWMPRLFPYGGENEKN